MSAATRPVAVSPKNILVALDAGALANDAILRGLELSRLFDARLALLHAVGVPGVEWELLPDPAAVARREDPLTKIRAALVNQVGDLLEAHEEKRSRAAECVSVVSGRPAKVLVDAAHELRADLVMLGALRRRKGLDFGSTTRALLAKAPQSVWVQPNAPAPIRRIAVAIDHSQASMVALATAVGLAKRLKASITAIHVFDERQYAADAWDGITLYVPIEELRVDAQRLFEKAMQEFSWHGVQHDTQFVGGMPAERILELAASTQLIVMGTHGRGFIAANLLGSVAYAVLKHSEMPVWVVR